MKHAQIKGLLMIAEVSIRDISITLGVHPDLVARVIRGNRGAGPDARRVRGHIARVLEMEEQVLWPTDEPAATPMAEQPSASFGQAAR